MSQVCKKIPIVKLMAYRWSEEASIFDTMWSTKNLTVRQYVSIFCFIWFHIYGFIAEVTMTERKRQNLIQELFETEEKYLDNLKLVFEVC